MTAPLIATSLSDARKRLALSALKYDVLEPERGLGRRPLFGDATQKGRLSNDDANRQRALMHRHAKQLGWVARLARENDVAALQQVVVNVINSQAAKASVLSRLAFKEGLSYDVARITERAAKLNVNDVCRDPVVMILKEKDGGVLRTTLKFGWRHRARQMLIRDVLYAAGVCNEYDYNFRAHGPQRAISRIVQGVEADFLYWLTLDIKDCFASVKPEHLYGITPLQGVVLKRAAFLPSSVPIQCSDTQWSIPIEQAARRGLPQGSMASGPLASALLGREIRLAIAGHSGVVVVIYADDIAIGARTQDQIETIRHKIGERLASLNGGPLFLKFCKVGHANSGFDFVQRHIRRKQWNGVHEVRVQPSQSAFERLKKKLRTQYGDAVLGQALDQSMDGALDNTSTEIVSRINMWARAMGWKIQPEWEETILTFCLAY